jgi:hypothetical protein
MVLYASFGSPFGEIDRFAGATGQADGIPFVAGRAMRPK